MKDRATTFKEYYGYYLSLHKNRYCRRLHFAGQIVTILFTIFAIYSKFWILLLAAPFVIYPFAWFGHFIFEKNTPAAFHNPILAKICDWVMFCDIVRGKIPF